VPTDLSDGEVCVAMIGSWNLYEAGREFLEAVRLVNRHCLKVTFVIVGGMYHERTLLKRWSAPLIKALGIVPDYRSIYQHICEELQIEGVVRLLDYEFNVEAIFVAADIIVTGGRAGLGRQVLEAAAARRPVICITDIPDETLIRDGETGFIVPLESPELLAEAIERLALNGELRHQLGENGYTHAVAAVDGPRVAERLMDLYERLVAT